MEIHKSAKGLIDLGDNSLVFVIGKSGRVNLVGGGIDTTLDPPESPIKAFLREAKEEIGVNPGALTNIRELFEIKGEVLFGSGVRGLANWTVFKAGLSIPFSELYIPPDSEIVEITRLSPQEFCGHPNASEIGKQAILMGTS